MTSVREHRGWSDWARRTMVSGALAAGIVFLPLIATEAGAQETTHTYSALYTFTGGTDGYNPTASLIADGAGNLYGTTGGGGNTSSSCPSGSFGCGVVFKLDPAGNETVLYTFTGGADGGGPGLGALVLDPAGSLYGTTTFGGDTASCSTTIPGCGVVFKLDPAGNETVLHAFTGGADGSNTVAGVIRDPAGNLYGTTFAGGQTSASCRSGCGVAFRLDPAGNETVLYNFNRPADGVNPFGGLIRDAAGNLYGTTVYGGNIGRCRAGNGCGVVFKLDPAGNETVLYTFTGGADGGGPEGALLRDQAGNLYGTTSAGGNTRGLCAVNGGCGVVFKLDTAGGETVLHSFASIDGSTPLAGVIRDAAGDLYGTTYSGGPTGNGLVFKLSPAGKETVLYSFTGGTDGQRPQAGLLAYQGFLYGTTLFGGSSSGVCAGAGCGVVFKVSVR